MVRSVGRALALAAALAAAAAIDCSFSSIYPRQYVAYKTAGDIVVDGKLDEPAWTEVGFTDPFVDISTNTTPKFDTRAKIRWDDTNLYIGAVVTDEAIWANITHTCHCYDPSEDQVVGGSRTRWRTHTRLCSCRGVVLTCEVWVGRGAAGAVTDAPETCARRSSTTTTSKSLWTPRAARTTTRSTR